MSIHMPAGIPYIRDEGVRASACCASGRGIPKVLMGRTEPPFLNRPVGHPLACGRRHRAPWRGPGRMYGHTSRSGRGKQPWGERFSRLGHPPRAGRGTSQRSILSCRSRASPTFGEGRFAWFARLSPRGAASACRDSSRQCAAAPRSQQGTSRVREKAVRS